MSIKPGQAQAFDAIVIGDIKGGDDPQSTDLATLWNGAIRNGPTWAAAINGNTLIVASDPEDHSGNNSGIFSPSELGAIELIQTGIRFGANVGNTNHTTGLFITLSSVLVTERSPVENNKTKLAINHLLEPLGQFSLVRNLNNTIVKTYSHPLTDCLTGAELSNWQNSSHQGFVAWPIGYVPLAVVTDTAPEFWTPAELLPTGINGTAYILAKGSLNSFLLTPVKASLSLGQTHTVTATLKNTSGAGLSGVSVSLAITSGPNMPHAFTAGTTGAGGTVYWQYTGNTTGRDTLVATAAASSGCAATAMAVAEWAPSVTITATDPIAAEGTPPNTGIFTLTRTGSTSGSLTVNLIVSGTATYGSTDTDPGADYTLDWSDSFTPTDAGRALGTVTFNAGQASKTVTVTPVTETGAGVVEAVETVILRILPDMAAPITYAVGSTQFATVNITSLETDTVTLVDGDSNLDETGNNPGFVTVHRSNGTGDCFVKLAFGGTATFGVDYEIGVNGQPPDPDFTGTVSLRSGDSNLTLNIIPIPDSRAEKPLETVIITLLPDDSYTVGGPAAKTLNIMDDDDNNLPASGYLLTDLGGNNRYAYGVNTVPDGAGGYRGQVAGTTFQTQSDRGFRWDNGSLATLTAPATGFPWGYAAGWTGANALNDAATTVGQSTILYSGSYYGTACYWPAGQTVAVPLTGLNGIGGVNNMALDLNQRGVVNDPQLGPVTVGGLVVGQSQRSDGKVHTVVWIPNGSGAYGAAMDLQDLGDGTVIKISYAMAINKFAQVVGRSQITGGNNYHGFLSGSQQNNSINNQWEPLQLSSADDDMGTATGVDIHTSEFTDVNDNGEIVGRGNAPSGQMRALYKVPGTGKDTGYYDLGVLSGGTNSVAKGISNHGLIVGQSGMLVGAGQVARAFVAGNAGTPGSQPLVNLNDVTSLYVWNPQTQVWELKTAVSQGWTLLSAERVNRVGWIAGYGTKNGVTRAFVLSPR